jgi:hypothetical protein
MVQQDFQGKTISVEDLLEIPADKSRKNLVGYC